MPRLASLLPPAGAARMLTVATLVATLGRGMFVTASAVFFLRSVGLSAAQVGLGLTIAAAIGLAAGVPVGHLADRVGPRGVAVAFGAVEAALVCGYLLVHSFPAFVVTAAVVALAQESAGAGRGALIAGAVTPQERVRTRAYLRSVTNLGMAAGAAAAGVALQVNTRGGYVALVLATAVMMLAGALLLLTVPAVRPLPRPPAESRWVALRDRPFLAVTALNGILCVHYGLLSVVVPLWVVERTAAPPATVAAIMLINTVMVVLLQVRASRDTRTVPGAARSQRQSGFLLAAACLLYAVAAGPPRWAAVVVLGGAALIHVFGELRHSAGSWGLGYELAADHAQGQYQAVFSIGFTAATVATPGLATALVLAGGWLGWLVLAVIFVATGMAVPTVAAWAERTRPAASVATATGATPA